jgi:hypothetical protein
VACETSHDDEASVLEHMDRAHGVSVVDPGGIADLGRYLGYYRAAGRAWPAGTVLGAAAAASGAAAAGGADTAAVASASSEDAQLRTRLRSELLSRVLAMQERERTDTDFRGRCLFCRKILSPRRRDLLDHMFAEHGFNVGRADNLVFVDDLLAVLRARMERIECPFCAGVFPSHEKLKSHMRKKRHFKIRPDDTTFDRFYVSNYRLEQPRAGRSTVAGATTGGGAAGAAVAAATAGAAGAAAAGPPVGSAAGKHHAVPTGSRTRGRNAAAAAARGYRKPTRSNNASSAGKGLASDDPDKINDNDDDDDYDDDDDSGVEEWDEGVEWRAQCLFCAVVKSSGDDPPGCEVPGRALFSHMAEVHGFDMDRERAAMRLDFHGAVALVNYVRRCIANVTCPACGVADLPDSAALAAHIAEAGHAGVGGDAAKFTRGAELERNLLPFDEDDELLQLIADDDGMATATEGVCAAGASGSASSGHTSGADQ